jgi:hypothetical protein
MSNTQQNGQDHHDQQGSDADSYRSGTAGNVDTMFGRLRDAAAKHDGDYRLLPLVQDGTATSKQKQPRGGSPPAEARDGTPPSDPS